MRSVILVTSLLLAGCATAPAVVPAVAPLEIGMQEQPTTATQRVGNGPAQVTVTILPIAQRPAARNLLGIFNYRQVDHYELQLFNNAGDSPVSLGDELRITAQAYIPSYRLQSPRYSSYTGLSHDMPYRIVLEVIGTVKDTEGKPLVLNSNHPASADFEFESTTVNGVTSAPYAKTVNLQPILD